MSNITHTFPAQQLPYNQKGKTWRKQCVDFACNHNFLISGANRKSLKNKRINYDLLNGIIDMQDIEVILNPNGLQDDLVPDKIQHYPIINSKLNVLRGEESKRLFDYKAIVTDPNSISEASNAKKAQILQDLQQLVQNTSASEEEANQKLEELDQYYSYKWQDFREQRANILLNHYNKEINFSILFNDGIMDALTVGEEMYLCDIVGGEPIIEKLNPNNVTVFRSSYSKKVEDADMIIIEDYLSPGKITDIYGEFLTDKDRKYLENISNSHFSGGNTDEMANWDERNSWVYVGDDKGNHRDKQLISELFNSHSYTEKNSVCDFDGNIRVVRVFWKSRRKIKKVTSFDPITAEENIDFYPETYIADKDRGEKEEAFWINEAWEGTKIGDEIYVNIRPRPIQYNRLSNPSLCHFGIIGSIYSVNDSEPYSMVDMMKPYNYLYDVAHYRLNRLIARNYGKLAKLDLSLVPNGWKVDKWLYFARKDGIAVVNSFNEGRQGAATGKLAGGLNNASNGVIDLDEGNTIQQYMNLMEFAKLEMAEVVGISKQREGQIANRETVGGVERATLQSSHITEWVFTIHEDLKRRVLDCFIETAKIAIKGRNKKFQYIMPDFAQRLVDIDGDEFAEADYGIVIDSSQQSQALHQKMDALVQAAMQNQMINFSTALKMFASCSLSEKMRMVESNERQAQQRAQQQQQADMQAQQQQLQMEAQLEQQKLELENTLNERDNDTKLTIAIMQAESNNQEPVDNEESTKEALLEKMREFDLKLQLDRDRLEFDKQKADADRKVKREQIHAHKATPKK